MLGEIIIRPCGQSYDANLRENILDPLKTTRSNTTKNLGLSGDVSLAYSALEYATPFNVPLPGSSASGAMGPAGGLMNVANYLSRYYVAFPKEWTSPTSIHNDVAYVGGEEGILGCISWIFTPLQDYTSSTVREKSYAAG